MRGSHIGAMRSAVERDKGKGKGWGHKVCSQSGGLQTGGLQTGGATKGHKHPASGKGQEGSEPPSLCGLLFPGL